MGDLRSGTRRAVAAWVLVGLVAAMPGFAAEQPYGGATPEELVARIQAAAESGDFGEMMACMSPEDRKALGGTMVMMGVMMVGFSQMAVDMGGSMAEGMSEAFAGEEMDAEEKARMEAEMAEARAGAEAMMEKLRAALEPHGLAGMLDDDFEPGSEKDQELEAALDNADMIALTESMMQLLAELDDGEDDEEGGGLGMGGDPAEEAAPDWVGQEVTDYRIDGDTATARAGDETLEMVRIDGRWYFAPEMQMEEMEMDGMEMPAEGEPMPEDGAAEPPDGR